MTEDLFRHLRAHVGNKKMDEKIMAQEMKELESSSDESDYEAENFELE